MMIRNIACTHGAKLCEKLRKQNVCTSKIQVFVCIHHPGLKLNRLYKDIWIHLKYATQDTPVCLNAIQHGLEQLFKQSPNMLYIKLGILYVCEHSSNQVNMFSTHPKNRFKLMTTIDQINQNGTRLFFGSQGVKNNIWKPGKRYTTSWNEIPDVI